MNKKSFFKSTIIVLFCILLSVGIIFNVCSIISGALPDSSEENTANETVLPPKRTAEPEYHAALFELPLDNIIENADAIAWVRVGNWIGEQEASSTDKGMLWERSFYEAEVIKVYRGTIDEKITLSTAGSSERTFNYDPLYVSGNEMILFLKKAMTECGQADRFSARSILQPLLTARYTASQGLKTFSKTE